MEISIALGGGGAKGNAHIGVLRVLEKNGFKIKALAGTSFGGVVGALYAAGFSATEIEDEFSRIDPRSMYGRKAGDSPSLLGLEGLERQLDTMLGEVTFQDLHIPLAVTAVDLNQGVEIIIDQGSVIEAVLATVAVPGIFPPRKRGQQLLADGGILNPVPVSAARNLAPRLPVVAVVLSAPQETWTRETLPRFEAPVPSPVIARLARLRVTQAFNIFVRSLDIGNRMMTDLRLQFEKPDVIIRPKVEDIGLLDRVDVSAVAALGEEAALQALPALHKAVSWRNKFSKLLPFKTLNP